MNIEQIRQAFAPFAAALKANDNDTLGRLDPDCAILFTLAGSWTNSMPVTMGDLRRLAAAIESEPSGSDNEITTEHHVANLEQLVRRLSRCVFATPGPGVTIATQAKDYLDQHCVNKPSILRSDGPFKYNDQLEPHWDHGTN